MNLLNDFEYLFTNTVTYHTEYVACFGCRDELEQENFQDNTVLQIAEKEEEEIDRIREESRKRKHAILEKFKTRHSQQKLEAKMEIDAKTSLSDEETRSAQDEAAVTPLVEKSLSVEKSPEQVVPPALKVVGSGALGEGTPKVC